MSWADLTVASWRWADNDGQQGEPILVDSKMKFQRKRSLTLHNYIGFSLCFFVPLPPAAGAVALDANDDNDYYDDNNWLQIIDRAQDCYSTQFNGVGARLVASDEGAALCRALSAVCFAARQEKALFSYEFDRSNGRFLVRLCDERLISVVPPPSSPPSTQETTGLPLSSSPMLPPASPLLSLPSSPLSSSPTSPSVVAGAASGEQSRASADAERRARYFLDSYVPKLLSSNGIGAQDIGAIQKTLDRSLVRAALTTRMAQWLPVLIGPPGEDTIICSSSVLGEYLALHHETLSSSSLLPAITREQPWPLLTEEHLLTARRCIHDQIVELLRLGVRSASTLPTTLPTTLVVAAASTTAATTISRKRVRMNSLEQWWYRFLKRGYTVRLLMSRDDSALLCYAVQQQQEPAAASAALPAVVEDNVALLSSATEDSVAATFTTVATSVTDTFATSTSAATTAASTCTSTASTTVCSAATSATDTGATTTSAPTSAVCSTTSAASAAASTSTSSASVSTSTTAASTAAANSSVAAGAASTDEIHWSSCWLKVGPTELLHANYQAFLRAHKDTLCDADIVPFADYTGFPSAIADHFFDEGYVRKSSRPRILVPKTATTAAEYNALSESSDDPPVLAHRVRSQVRCFAVPPLDSCRTYFAKKYNVTF
jgi:hypothetical protein